VEKKGGEGSFPPMAGEPAKLFPTGSFFERVLEKFSDRRFFGWDYKNVLFKCFYFR
jgi:hypothetical protein